MRGDLPCLENRDKIWPNCSCEAENMGARRSRSEAAVAMQQAARASGGRSGDLMAVESCCRLRPETPETNV
jgi:hypothetical protein